MARQILRNASWFGLIQISNFILPLLTIPHLTRTLLPASFGLMALVLAISAFLALVCDYGFNWSAMRLISANRDDRAYLRQTFADVMTAKFAIFALVAAIYCIAILIVPTLRHHWSLSALSIIAVLGSTCFPYWFLQGIEKTASIAILSLAARLVSVVTILSFVQAPRDAAVAVLLTAAPSLFSGLVGIGIVRHWLGGVPLPSVAGVLHQLRDGWSTFLGTLTIGAYTSAQAVIVGALGGPTTAGYFVSAERCMSAGKSVLSIVTQSTLPRVAYLAEREPDEGIKLIRRILWLSPVTLCASLSMLLAPRLIIQVIFGEAFVGPVEPLFRILSPVPLLLSFSSCFASLYMYNFGHRRLWGQMLIGASFISLTTTLALHTVFPAHISAASGVTLAELFVALLSGTIFWRDVRKRSRFTIENSTSTLIS